MLSCEFTSNSNRNSSLTSSQTENGYMDSIPLLDSEKAVKEFVQQQHVKGVDEHLIEFSEELRIVAKALRRVAEGKASAQAEAAEWKRKYEIERARNLRKEHEELSSGGGHCDTTIEKPGSISDLNDISNLANDQSERCCGKHGICSHEVLKDGEAESNPMMVRNKIAKKAFFKLQWGCNAEKNGQHKHDVVSFERGNITTAERSSKQIFLKWQSNPQTILILTKPNSTPVRVLCAEMVRWLKDQKKINVYVEPRVRTELLSESSYFNFVQTWEDDEEVLLLHMKVDLVVTLGGDGTVLWAASMFKGPVPPLVPFSLGSLGFMTPFPSYLNPTLQYQDARLGYDVEMLDALCRVINRMEPDTIRAAAAVDEIKIFREGSQGFADRLAIHSRDKTKPESERYKEYLDVILKGPISITLRHRLQCHVVRNAAKNELETEGPFLVLNEVTIDRGISSFLTNLECYCDNSFVTLVQGDGLILSTTSGSTAYSLAAGGSMVHPQVPGILFTPICPHSLSFRPLILPEYVTLRVQVPFNSRGHTWASFDGKNRIQLAPGDALVCSMAPWPVPMACQVDSTNDFLRSIHDGLHWNLRKIQSVDGLRDS